MAIQDASETAGKRPYGGGRRARGGMHAVTLGMVRSRLCHSHGSDRRWRVPVREERGRVDGDHRSTFALRKDPGPYGAAREPGACEKPEESTALERGQSDV